MTRATRAAEHEEHAAHPAHPVPVALERANADMLIGSAVMSLRAACAAETSAARAEPMEAAFTYLTAAQETLK